MSRAWNRLTANFVRSATTRGRYADGGGLYGIGAICQIKRDENSLVGVARGAAAARADGSVNRGGPVNRAGRR